MANIIVAYLLATLFGLVAFIVHGYEELLNSPHVDYIFCGLILAGVILQLLELTICKPLCKTFSTAGSLFKWMPCCR